MKRTVFQSGKCISTIRLAKNNIDGTDGTHVDDTTVILCRSKEFRPTVGRLAEIRAFVPVGTPLMACTATASKSVKKEVIGSLEMTGCVEVTASPNRPNIYYEVKPRSDVDTDFLSLISTLSKKSIQTPCVFVYCQLLDMCADLYAHFIMSLGKHHTILQDLHISVTFVSLGCSMPARLSTTMMSS